MKCREDSVHEVVCLLRKNLSVYNVIPMYRAETTRLCSLIVVEYVCQMFQWKKASKGVECELVTDWSHWNLKWYKGHHMHEASPLIYMNVSKYIRTFFFSKFFTKFPLEILVSFEPKDSRLTYSYTYTLVRILLINTTQSVCEYSYWDKTR
jgi:hypothetical protein